MSKAKEYAEKFILTVDHQGDVEEAYNDGYNDGYKQAEKDLDLSTLGLLVIRVKNEDVRKRFGFIKNFLEKRHDDIIKGLKVSTGTMRI